MQTIPRLQTIAPNAVRVTHYDPSRGIPIDRPWVEDVLLPFPESDKHGNKITVAKESNLIAASNSNGECFFREIASPRIAIQKKRLYFYFDVSQTAFYAGLRKIEAGIHIRLRAAPDESFFGWGEWFNTFERKSGNIFLDNRDALFNQQNYQTYSGIPFFISSKGYGFLLLNSHRSQWHISAHEMSIEADGPAADYILIYGPTIKEILRTYTALTGRPPLPPRWGFGLWVTCYPQEHQDKVLELVQQHRDKKIPLDAVILDYHWEERFHNFNWRRSLIPDPQKLVTNLRSQEIRLGLILTSFLNSRNRPKQKWLLNTFGHNLPAGLEHDDERALDEFTHANTAGFLAHKNVRWWFGSGGMIDFTNHSAVDWWQKKLQLLFNAGANFIKNDGGEDLPDDAQSSNGMDGSEYHNIYGFYYSRATYQSQSAGSQHLSADQLAENPQPRSLVYARTAWVGSQRYPALFLGDQQAGYEGIRHGLRGGLNLALAGFSYWTADVFGLLGKTTPETHMRYAQWSLFSPIARYFVRPEKTDNTRYPWSHNAEVEANFRKYTELRMQLLPYYNSLAHESYLTGLPIMRPGLIEFENDVRLRSVDDQIMLGGALMICPILEKGAVSRKIVLPEGLWHDFWSESSWEGSTIIEYPAPMDCLPILVRGGTILPLGPILQNIPDGHCFDSLEYHIWPPYPAEGVFFDDDGISTAYKQGAFSRTLSKAENKDGNLVVHISAAEGGFPEQALVRKIKIVSHGGAPIESARVNAKIVPCANQPGFSHLSFEHLTLEDSIIELSFLS